MNGSSKKEPLHHILESATQRGDAATPGADPAKPVAWVGAKRVKVLVADDHALVRDGMKLLLRPIASAGEIVEAHDAESLSDALRFEPDLSLALVDLNMPGMDQGARLAEIVEQGQNVPIVVVSAMTAADVVRRTMQIPSVYAFVSKGASREQMLDAVRDGMQRIRRPYQAPADAAQGSVTQLTPRMEEVRHLLRQGLTNKMIATRLGITEGTVKNHMSDIFKALNVANRLQAAQVRRDH
jgi:DNA-binding NarL/FixJ family response regulator